MIPRPFRLSVPRFSTSTRYGKSIVSWTLATLILTSALTAAEQNQYVAGDYLVIDQQEALENGASVRLTLRNASERTITAWSILYEAGTSEGLTNQASTARDNYYQLPFPEGWKGLPLAPGHTTIVDIELDGVDLSPDRFAQGNYAVFSARVSAVFFDDGQALGDEGDLIKRFVDRRVAEVAADLLVRERLANLRATLGQGEAFLEGLRNLAGEKNRLGPNQIPVARNSQDLMLLSEQSALNSAIMHAENILRMAERIGSQEAYILEAVCNVNVQPFHDQDITMAKPTQASCIGSRRSA